MKAPYHCQFCDTPSWIAPAKQRPPATACNAQTHGQPDVLTAQWLSIKEHGLPRKNVPIVAMLESGIPVFGRNLQGVFCWYHAGDDRFYEYHDVDAVDGFAGFTHYLVLPLH
jgi:hypothetical protein